VGTSAFSGRVDNALQQHASNLFAVSNCGRYGSLKISGKEMLVFARDGRARHLILHFSGRNVRFHINMIDINHLIKFNKNHVRAMVTQSRGTEPALPCSHCRKGPVGPFVVCANVPGQLDSRCGNCRFRGRTKCDAVTNRRKPAAQAMASQPTMGATTLESPLILLRDYGEKKEDPIVIQ
jgi:hypothetical protein